MDSAGGRVRVREERLPRLGSSRGRARTAGEAGQPAWSVGRGPRAVHAGPLRVWAESEPALRGCP